MIVCIAEKPSVARDIADVLGAKNRKEGYIEGNGYQVTWTFGHLCTLKEPHEYTPSWKSWSLSSLPMIPPRFGIKLINDRPRCRERNVVRCNFMVRTLLFYRLLLAIQLNGPMRLKSPKFIQTKKALPTIFPSGTKPQ